jgi:rubrerythrin
MEQHSIRIHAECFEMQKILREDNALLLGERDALHAQVTQLWECPDCGFAFDASHTNDNGEGEYSCPVCNESRLETQVAQLRKAIRRLRDERR